MILCLYFLIVLGTSENVTLGMTLPLLPLNHMRAEPEEMVFSMAGGNQVTAKKELSWEVFKEQMTNLLRVQGLQNQLHSIEGQPLGPCSEGSVQIHQGSLGTKNDSRPSDSYFLPGDYGMQCVVP